MRWRRNATAVAHLILRVSHSRLRGRSYQGTINRDGDSDQPDGFSRATPWKRAQNSVADNSADAHLEPPAARWTAETHPWFCWQNRRDAVMRHPGAFSAQLAQMRSHVSTYYGAAACGQSTSWRLSILCGALPTDGRCLPGIAASASRNHITSAVDSSRPAPARLASCWMLAVPGAEP
jgi:hypothetical protein